jgi:U3 small nucleolar RNA-associated protein 25
MMLGMIPRVMCRVNQIFQRIPCQEFAQANDAKFRYFCDHVLSPMLRFEQKQTLIITSTYFDFVLVRNELIRREV